MIATAMAHEGARLVICDINPEALKPVAAQLAEIGAEHLAVCCDVSDSAAVDAKDDLMPDAARDDLDPAFLAAQRKWHRDDRLQRVALPPTPLERVRPRTFSKRQLP